MINKNMNLPRVVNAVITVLMVAALIGAGIWLFHWMDQVRVLKQVIERLSADSRIAEILVTKSEYDEQTKKYRTTIKFLEYDTQAKPLEPKYFTFEGNVIQFQSLVIRFQDQFVKGGDKLRGKSAYLFMKAFVLEGKQPQIFDINKVNEVPSGYQISDKPSEFETQLWGEFWNYALDPKKRNRAGIKNAQIEAPGSLFIPGTIYRLHIEHDGGLRIDAEPIPEILKGEKL